MMMMESDSSNSDSNQETSEPQRRLLSLAVLGSSIFLAGCTLSILAPFYTKEAEDHGLSVTSSGTVFASAFILQIVSTPVFGKYLHKIGSKRLFIVGCIISGLTNIMFGFLPRIKSGSVFLTLSLVIRSMTAVGESAMSTSVYPLAMRCDSRSQSTVLAIMETMFGAGTTIGPFVGGFLFEYGGFLMPFAICGGLLLVSGMVALLLLPGYEHDDSDGDSETADEDGDDVEAPHDAGVVVVSSSPYSSLLHSPLIIVSAMVTFLTGVSTQWYQPSLEPFVRGQFGLTSFQASLLFIIDGGIYSLIAPLTGKILDKGVDSLTVLGVGSFVICLGYLLLAPIVPFILDLSLEQIAIGAGIHGLGMALNFIGTISLMTQVTDKLCDQVDQEQRHGIATSIWITSESLGGFVGSAAGGASYDYFGWRNSCILVSSLQALSMLMVVSVILANTCTVTRERRERSKLTDERKRNYDFLPQIWITQARDNLKQKVQIFNIA